MSLYRKFKHLVLRIFSIYDLHQYNKYVDILFLPTLKMKDKIPVNFSCKCMQLPPGFDKKCSGFSTCKKANINSLKLLYVGGVNRFYNISLLLKAIGKLKNVYITICCRKLDWQNYGSEYTSLLNDKIFIVHKKGNELKTLYNDCDIACHLAPPVEPFTFAMPIKLFEYIGYNKPILTYKGSEMADMITSANIGWAINYTLDDICSFFNNLELKELKEKNRSLQICKPLHTWDQRAMKVHNVLNGTNHKSL